MLDEIRASLGHYFTFGEAEPNDLSIQRREERLQQNGRALWIVIDTVRVPFIVKNISDSGVSGHVEVLPDVGADLRVEFEHGFAAAGRVRWVKGSNIGISFAATLPRDVIQPNAESSAHSPRAPRFEVMRHAQLYVGAISGSVTIVNVSRGGARVETSLALVRGQKVRLEIKGYRSIDARVRWRRLTAVGLMFDETISLKDFDAATRL
jgi:hypothetical protein